MPQGFVGHKGFDHCRVYDLWGHFVHLSPGFGADQLGILISGGLEVNLFSCLVGTGGVEVGTGTCCQYSQGIHKTGVFTYVKR